VKHSNTWYALILIPWAFLLSGGKAAAQSPSATAPSKPPAIQSLKTRADVHTDVAKGNPPRTLESPFETEIAEALRAIERQQEITRAEDQAREERWWPPSPSWAIVYVTVAYVIVAAFQWWSIKRQADIAERTLTEIERPWMMIIPASFKIYPETGTTQTPRQITFSWIVRNVGRSPAWLTAGRAGAEKIRADELPPTPEYPKPFTYSLTPSPPDEEGREESARLNFTPAEYVALCEGRLDFIVRGYISYRGLGNRLHETRFCIGIQKAEHGLAMSFCGPPTYNAYT